MQENNANEVEENEELCLDINPFKQNNDYGGNFIDKVKERLSKREKRASLLNKCAQEIGQKYFVGDKVKSTSGTYAGLAGTITEYLGPKVDGHPPFYRVNLIIFGRPFPIEFSQDDLALVEEAPKSVRSPNNVKLETEEDQIPDESISISDRLSMAPVTLPNTNKRVYRLESDVEFSGLNQRLFQAINSDSGFSLGELLSGVYDLNNVDSDLKYAAILKLESDNPASLIDRVDPLVLENILKDYPDLMKSALKKVLFGYSGIQINIQKVRILYAFAPEIFHEKFKSLDQENFIYNFITTRSTRNKPPFGYLMEDIKNGEELELKEIIRPKINEYLSASGLYNSGLFYIYPEIAKEKFQNDQKILNDPKKILLISYTFPEFRKYIPSAFESSPRAMLKFIRDNFLRMFIDQLEPEERSVAYPHFVESPNEVLYDLKLALDEGGRSTEVARKIINEIPPDIKEKIARKSADHSASYFFFINGPDILRDISNDAKRYLYQKFMKEILEKNIIDASIFAESGTNEYAAIFGIPEKVMLYLVDRPYLLKKGTEIYDLVNRTFALRKIDRFIESDDQEIDESTMVILNKYFKYGLYTSNEEFANKFNDIIKIKEQKNQLIYDKEGYASTIGYINIVKNDVKLDQETLSILYRDADRLLGEFDLQFVTYAPFMVQRDGRVTKSKKTIGTIINNWLPLASLDKEELSEESFREYAEFASKYSPLNYFTSDGFSEKDPKDQTNEQITFEKYFERFIGGIQFSTEPTDKDIEIMREVLKKEYDKDQEQKSRPLLYKRYPELFNQAFQNFDYYELDIAEILYIFRDHFSGLQNTPDHIMDAVLNANGDTNSSFYKLLNDRNIISHVVSEIPNKFQKEYLLEYISHWPETYLNKGLPVFHKYLPNVAYNAIDNLEDSSFSDQWGGAALDKYFYDELFQHEDLIQKFIEKMKKLNSHAIKMIVRSAPKILEYSDDIPVSFDVMRAVENISIAKKMYKNIENDIPNLENLPEQIKINKSIYQLEQRPDQLQDETRYTISNNNTDPTDVLYDIGKQLIHAGDGVAHTNVGVSGFTNSWALCSIIEVDDGEGIKVGDDAEDMEKTILIEQYQSDYPPVLYHLFSGQGYEEYSGQSALNNLIEKYGDKEAILNYRTEQKDKTFSIANIDPEFRIEDLGLSVRAFKSLERMGLEYVYEITQYSADDLLKEPWIGRKTLNEIKDVLLDHNIYLKNDPNIPGEEDANLPIELAPAVKDARTHFEYISKAYPYLAIMNTIEVAKQMNFPNIHILKDAAYYANIQNKDKAKKLYEDIPSSIGDIIYDSNNRLNLWRIPATDETIQSLKAMLQNATGKDDDYNFSLTPAQNAAAEEERRKEKRKKKQSWNATPDKIDRLREIERQIAEKLPDVEVPNFYSPQQALRYLGEKVNGKILSKNEFKREFGLINRDLGMLARASRRRLRMIKLAALNRALKFGDLNED